jgi:hypothetical protein
LEDGLRLLHHRLLGTENAPAVEIIAAAYADQDEGYAKNYHQRFSQRE